MCIVYVQYVRCTVLSGPNNYTRVLIAHWFLKRNMHASVVLCCRFQIISTKRRAVISGVQRQAGGGIDWSEHLPEDTRISRWGIKMGRGGKDGMLRERGGCGNVGW